MTAAQEADARAGLADMEAMIARHDAEAAALRMRQRAEMDCLQRRIKQGLR